MITNFFMKTGSWT